jgi:hypothetical protein
MRLQRHARRYVWFGLVALLLGLLPAAAWSATELKIGYMAHPIHEVSIKWMKQWAEKNNVTITAAPVSYEVYVEKMTSSGTTTTGGSSGGAT